MMGMTPAWLTRKGRYCRRAAVDAAAADVLGALRGDAPLALADEHHAGDHAHEEHHSTRSISEAHLAAAAAQLQAASCIMG